VAFASKNMKTNLLFITFVLLVGGAIGQFGSTTLGTIPTAQSFDRDHVGITIYDTSVVVRDGNREVKLTTAQIIDHLEKHFPVTHYPKKQLEASTGIVWNAVDTDITSILGSDGTGTITLGK
jgi:hypothetical protein